MDLQRIFEQVHHNIREIVDQSTPLGISLWHEIIKMHPADIAQVFSYLDRDSAMKLFLLLSESLKLAVFNELSYVLKVACLSLVNDHDRSLLLSHLPIDELTDFLDELSDEELKKYLLLLHKKDREQVLSLLKFKPDSAGGIMDTNVLSLIQDWTVEKSIQILQRLQPSRDLHHQIFVVNPQNQLLGHINLEDLVLKHPQTRLSSILRANTLVAFVNEDREEIAKKMVHYNLMTVPVVDEHDLFLGVIPSDTLVEIIEEEASEDIYRMAALTPIKHTYFETPFFKLLYQRSSILMVLLIIQSLSSIIINRYEATLAGFLMLFITMLTSTGGNTSSQTSALVIQGMAVGEIDETTMTRFIRRELLMSLMIALALGLFSFVRIYLVYNNLSGSIVVSLSLAVIVMVSVILGSCMPIMLKKLKLDPAQAAGPLLATLMDVVGLLIYCLMSQLFLL
ncbi:MAG: magnesium transporter [Candidatus Babeliaceae bacterium]